MKLFIPRKQNITGIEAVTTDSAHSFGPPPSAVPPLGIPSSAAASDTWGRPKSESSGFDPPHLEKALRQNFLAIQNWANQRGVSAAVKGSTNETLANNVWTQPSFDTKNWDYSAISSSSAQHFTVPEDGIYVIGVGASFSAIPGQTHLSVSINGGTYPAQHGFLLGSTAGTWTGMLGGSQQQFSKGQVLTPAVLALMPNSSDTCQVILNEFALTKLFDKPSKAQ